MIPRDRSFEVHASAGWAITATAIATGASAPAAVGLAVAAGIAVELVQWVYPDTGTASVRDAVYTAIGAVLAATVLDVLLS